MRVVLLLILFIVAVFGEDDLDFLLDKIEYKSDLSQKTKKENWGITYVYTRQDIEKMQARYLRDILISLLPFTYKINNYGIYDPLSSSTNVPFMSSSIKVFIDNQEINVGMYGSGLFLYGDMDISFADHIEAYIGSPSFEISTEPSFMVIRIYTKRAERDGGNRVGLFAQSYGGKMGYYHKAEELNNGWKYFFYANRFEDKNKNRSNLESSLNRDKDVAHLIFSLYNNDNRILLDASRKRFNGFIDQSIFGTPKKSDIGIDYFHLGYDLKKDRLKFFATFERSRAFSDFEDNNEALVKYFNALYGTDFPYNIYSDSYSDILSVGADYKYNFFEKHSFLFGFKYRYKHAEYDHLVYNDLPLPLYGNDIQKIGSAFLEYKNYFNENTIFNFGINKIRVTNNNSKRPLIIPCHLQIIL